MLKYFTNMKKLKILKYILYLLLDLDEVSLKYIVI